LKSNTENLSGGGSGNSETHYSKAFPIRSGLLGLDSSFPKTVELCEYQEQDCSLKTSSAYSANDPYKICVKYNILCILCLL